MSPENLTNIAYVGVGFAITCGVAALVCSAWKKPETKAQDVKEAVAVVQHNAFMEKMERFDRIVSAFKRRYEQEAVDASHAVTPDEIQKAHQRRTILNAEFDAFKAEVFADPTLTEVWKASERVLAEQDRLAKKQATQPQPTKL